MDNRSAEKGGWDEQALAELIEGADGDLVGPAARTMTSPTSSPPSRMAYADDNGHEDEQQQEDAPAAGAAGQADQAGTPPRQR